MKVAVYNQKGEKTESTVNLPKEIFEVPLNSDLVHQVAVLQMANRRQTLAHTKDRSEVSGGGKKPWRQKGTGRARAGSNRSPIWRHGGITFGPRKDKVFEREIPKKMRRKALFMVLSEKAKNDFVVVLEKLEAEKIKTKDVATLVKKLPVGASSCLLATPTYDKNIFLSARNIHKMNVQESRNLNVLDLLNSKYLLITKDTVKEIEKTFIK